MVKSVKKPNPITPTKGRPAAPKQLAGEARAEWDRVCDELDAMGTLATADRSIIALYAKAWARWMHAEEKIEELGAVVTAPVSQVLMQNPWVTIGNKNREHAMKLLGELGLSPRSRSIIAKNAAAGAVDEPEELD